MKIKSLICLLLIIVLSTFTLSGCYDSDSLENLAYVVALGIDKGENNKITLSLQIALPNADTGGSRK